MCIQLTLKEGCKKVHVMKCAMVSWTAACDHEKGSEVELVNGKVLCVEEAPTDIHEMLHKE